MGEWWSRRESANRTLSLLQQSFDQAERWGWRKQHTNPALHIDRYPEERRGERKEVMLSPDQMAKLLEAIDLEEAADTSSVACAAIRLAFWTGWRIGEVLPLQWANLDLERGTAKLLMTKTAQEEHRQLAAEAVGVLQALSATTRWCSPDETSRATSPPSASPGFPSESERASTTWMASALPDSTTSGTTL